MCCDATVCSADRQGIQNANDAPHAVPHHLNQSLHFGYIGRNYSHEGMVGMTQRQACGFSEATKKSVRQCARRCGSHIGVAQASPLFSDHAPREVHLWQ
jgi:hypothetical protein